MNALLFGDSHVGALRKGLGRLVESGDSAPTEAIRALPLCRGGILPTPFFQVEDQSILFSGCFIERLPLDPDTQIYGFSGNAHTTRVLRNIDWSRHAPAEVAKGEIAVTTAMMEAIFHADQRYMLQLLEAMARLGLPVFVIEAPHLFRHNAVFRKARREVLLHIDRAYRAYITRELAARNIAVVPVPPACRDSDGFMLDAYRSERTGDNHHANALFGEVMIAEVLAHLRHNGQWSDVRIAS